MRVIIAGGRDYWLTTEDLRALDRLHATHSFTTVLCGMAPGADACGYAWATIHGIPVEPYPADWDAHGRAAGAIRNIEMASKADAVVLFQGGPGTAHMKKTARNMGLKIFTRQS